MNKTSHTTCNSAQKKQIPSLVSGLTLIEVLISIAILVFLTTVTLGAFRLMSGNERVSVEAKKVISAIEEARSKTLSSEGGQRFGVYLLINQAVLYEDPYVENNINNKIFYIEGGVDISSFSLSGGGNQVLFQRISGETDNDGTINFVSSSGRTKQIIIQKTGNAYIE